MVVTLVMWTSPALSEEDARKHDAPVGQPCGVDDGGVSVPLEQRFPGCRLLTQQLTLTVVWMCVCMCTCMVL